MITTLPLLPLPPVYQTTSSINQTEKKTMTILSLNEQQIGEIVKWWCVEYPPESYFSWSIQTHATNSLITLELVSRQPSSKHVDLHGILTLETQEEVMALCLHSRAMTFSIFWKCILESCFQKSSNMKWGAPTSNPISIHVYHHTIPELEFQMTFRCPTEVERLHRLVRELESEVAFLKQWIPSKHSLALSLSKDLTMESYAHSLCMVKGTIRSMESPSMDTTSVPFTFFRKVTMELSPCEELYPMTQPRYLVSCQWMGCDSVKLEGRPPFLFYVQTGKEIVERTTETWFPWNTTLLPALIETRWAGSRIDRMKMDSIHLSLTMNGKLDHWKLEGDVASSSDSFWEWLYLERRKLAVHWMLEKQKEGHSFEEMVSMIRREIHEGKTAMSQLLSCALVEERSKPVKPFSLSIRELLDSFELITE